MDSSADPASPDVRLVRECRAGNENAWAALIQKYKRLIYSIPIRRGFSPADCGDIFQSVVADLLTNIDTLRDPQALPAWLIQVTMSRCRQFHTQQARESPVEEAGLPEKSDDSITAPDELMLAVVREQALRNAVMAAPPRCRRLIEMLFFENVPRPYPEIAESLGLAIGSIGFIRRRCLDGLRKRLLEAGF